MAAKVRFNRNVQRVVVTHLQAAGRRFVNRMITSRMSGPTTPSSISVRTGAARRAIKTKVISDSGRRLVSLFAFVDSTAPYLAVHEKGATIRPIKSKYLAIPVGKARTKAGVVKGAFRSPREIPDLFVLKTKARKLLLARRVGKKGKLDILYVLKKSVRIPARLGFKKTFAQHARSESRLLKSKLRKLGVKIRVT